MSQQTDDKRDEARKAADYILAMVARGARVTAQENDMAHFIVSLPSHVEAQQEKSALSDAAESPTGTLPAEIPDRTDPAAASAPSSTRQTYYANPKQYPQRGEAVNLAHNWLDGQGPNSGFHITTKGIKQLADAVILMDAWILEVTKNGFPSAPSATLPPEKSLQERIRYHQTQAAMLTQELLGDPMKGISAPVKDGLLINGAPSDGGCA